MENNRITELDLDVVANDIMDFYVGEDILISKDKIRELLDVWAEAKYPIYEKFGRKLSISTIYENENDEVSLRNEFEKISQDLFYKHRSKMTNGISIEEQNKHETLAHIHERMLSNSDFCALNVSLNQAFTDFSKLKSFVHLIRWHHWSLPVDDKLKKLLMSQTKLTRQVVLYLADVIKRDTNPDEWAKQRDKYLLDAFTIAVSEYTQISPRRAEYDFVLSIHPYDFVTMSYNSLNWSSCYKPGSDYAKSVFVVMSDASSIISFVPSRSDYYKEYAVMLNNKKTRAMVHYDTTYNSLIINNVYPNNLTCYTDMVKKIALEYTLTNEVTSYPIENDLHQIEVSCCMYDDLERNEIIYIGKQQAYDWLVGHDVGCMCCESNKYPYEDDRSWYCEDCDPYKEEVVMCPHCLSTCCEEDSHCWNCDYPLWDSCEQVMFMKDVKRRREKRISKDMHFQESHVLCLADLQQASILPEVENDVVLLKTLAYVISLKYVTFNMLISHQMSLKLAMMKTVQRMNVLNLDFDREEVIAEVITTLINSLQKYTGLFNRAYTILNSKQIEKILNSSNPLVFTLQRRE